MDKYLDDNIIIITTNIPQILLVIVWGHLYKRLINH